MPNGAKDKRQPSVSVAAQDASQRGAVVPSSVISDLCVCTLVSDTPDFTLRTQCGILHSAFSASVAKQQKSDTR